MTRPDPSRTGAGRAPVRPRRRSGRRDDRDGFALLVVVLLLFAVGVTAAATYQIVLGEHRLAGFERDAERARTIAHAGAMRFIAELHPGPPEASEATYDFGGNGGQARVADVSARRVLVHPDTWEEVWHLRSTGRVTDPRFFDFPATREVSTYARLRTPPVNVQATIMTLADAGSASAVVSDDDQSPQCSAPDLSPSAPWATGLAYAETGLPPWEVFTDEDWDIDWTGGLGQSPDYEEDPVVRVDGGGLPGGLPGGGLNWNGKGVLIAPGDLDLHADFEWDGIILVGGDLTFTGPGPPGGGPPGGWPPGTGPGGGGPPGQQNGNGDEGDPDGPTVRGMVLTGLAGGDPEVVLDGGEFLFDSCNVLEAGRHIAMLHPVAGALWNAY